MVEQLPAMLANDADRAREILRRHLGEVRMEQRGDAL